MRNQKLVFAPDLVKLYPNNHIKAWIPEKNVTYSLLFFLLVVATLSVLWCGWNRWESGFILSLALALLGVYAVLAFPYESSRNVSGYTLGEFLHEFFTTKLGGLIKLERCLFVSPVSSGDDEPCALVSTFEFGPESRIRRSKLSLQFLEPKCIWQKSVYKIWVESDDGERLFGLTILLAMRWDHTEVQVSVKMMKGMSYEYVQPYLDYVRDEHSHFFLELEPLNLAKIFGRVEKLMTRDK